MWNEVQWIKIPDMELRDKQILHGDLGGRFAYFRLEQELPADARLTARITAVSRYRLWVNDQAVLSGSCKGDLNRQYYETVSLTPYLHAGKNVFAVQVLYNDPDIARDQTDERAAIYGVVGAGNCHALAIDGDITDAFGRDWHHFHGKSALAGVAGSHLLSQIIGVYRLFRRYGGKR